MDCKYTSYNRIKNILVARENLSKVLAVGLGNTIMFCLALLKMDFLTIISYILLFLILVLYGFSQYRALTAPKKE